jgi:hypothetical protein
MGDDLLKMTCKHCRNNVEFTALQAGLTVNCPHCGKFIRIRIPIVATPTPDFSNSPWLKKPRYTPEELRTLYPKSDQNSAQSNKALWGILAGITLCVTGIALYLVNITSVDSAWWYVWFVVAFVSILFVIICLYQTGGKDTKSQPFQPISLQAANNEQPAKTNSGGWFWSLGFPVIAVVFLWIFYIGGQ